nr:hypothetical protein [Tanacetum cinerariifolium]
MLVNQDEGSGTPTEPHHTPSHEAQQSPHTALSSPSQPPASTETIPTSTPTEIPTLRDDSQGEAFPTIFGLEAGQDRENIIKTSALPHDSTPRVTSLAANKGTQDLEIYSLKARIKLLEDKDGGGAEPSGEDATIKGWKQVVQVVSVTPAAEVSTVGIPTSSGLVPTASLIFTTASVVTPYSRRKDLSIGEKLDMINELVKYQDHYAKVLKYQSQQSKPLFKKQQREFYMSVLKSHSGWKTKHFKGMALEEIREKFIPVWKQIEDFVPIAFKEKGERMKRKGLRLEQESAKKMKTSEEVSEEDLKEMMQLVPVEEVYVEALQVKHPIIDWEIHSEGHRNYWKIIRLGGSTAVYQFFMDMLKHFDREDLIQLWTLVKETVSIRHATSDKEKELWIELKRLFEPDFKDQLWIQTQALMHDPVEWRLYDTCGVHHVLTRYQEIFMLVEKDYPLRKGLAIVMISNKLHVENYSQMANDLILKIHNIANSLRQKDD